MIHLAKEEIECMQSATSKTNVVLHYDTNYVATFFETFSRLIACEPQSPPSFSCYCPIQ